MIADLLTCMTSGKSYLNVLTNYMRENADSLKFSLTEEDRAAVIEAGKQGNYKRWRQGVAIEMAGLKISRREISQLLGISRETIGRILTDYQRNGCAILFQKPPRNIETERQKKSRLKANRVLEILHQRPESFGFNRTSWTQPLIAQAYEITHGERVGISTVGDLIRKSGYSYRKARRILTSPDPDYAEKVETLLTIVHLLQEDQDLFFIDEFGPRAVKRYGGRLYVKKGETVDVPKNQASKGAVTLSGALSATTNQIYWIYGKTKDTRAMIDLIEILYNRFYQKTKIYITWDAASWHSSIELINWLDALNAGTVRHGNGPYVEFVPFPTSSQFLNVIESVFSSMAQAVIHHSDYGSAMEMKTAISKHFVDRNDFFKENPKRAGKQIWEIDFFNDFKNLRSGNYRQW